MAMVLSDIINVAIPKEVVQEAAVFARAMQSKNKSEKYRPLSSNHDEVGFCGHWAVENVLDNWGIPYRSTRTEIYKGGDLYDLEMLGRKLDIKCTSIGSFNEKYFYNYDFYVLKDWTDDPKSELIDDYVMVHIEKDLSKARIFGVTTRYELVECPVVGPTDWLRFANYHIKSRQLKSFYNYIFRT